MNLKTKKVIMIIGGALIFVSFLSFFTVLAIVLMITGIFVGFQWLFQYGWWATALVIIVVLAIYAAALSIGCSLLERKTA